MTWEQNGTVIASEGGLYEIYTDGGERIQCKPRGRFRHEKKKLLVGDRILVSADEAGNKWWMKFWSEKTGCSVRRWPM